LLIVCQVTDYRLKDHVMRSKDLYPFILDIIISSTIYIASIREISDTAIYSLLTIPILGRPQPSSVRFLIDFQ